MSNQLRFSKFILFLISNFIIFWVQFFIIMARCTLHCAQFINDKQLLNQVTYSSFCLYVVIVILQIRRLYESNTLMVVIGSKRVRCRRRWVGWRGRLRSCRCTVCLESSIHTSGSCTSLTARHVAGEQSRSPNTIVQQERANNRGSYVRGDTFMA